MPDTMPVLSPSTGPLRNLALAMNQHAARGDEPDLELGGIAGALLACAADLDEAIGRLAEQAKTARAERDRLDRTRPTEWAYEQAVKALNNHQDLRREVENKLHAVAQVRVWKNEDDRGFLFADDVRAALGAPTQEG